VVGAGLLLRSVWQLQQVDPGFRYESVLALRLSPPPSRYNNGPDVASYYERVLERLAQVPGVEATGAAAVLPLAGERMGLRFEIDGNRPPPGAPFPRAEYNPVSGRFLETLRVTLLKGRWLDAADGAAPRPASVLVNSTFAQEFFPDTDPIGHRLTDEGKEWVRIVGVVGDVRQHQLDLGPRPTIYVPHALDPMRRLYVTVRTAGDPAGRSAAVAAAVAELDPLVPITRLSPMTEVVSGSLARARLFASLLAGFATLALGLGAVGIYGVVSYGVGQRTREIGLRMALGADRGTVLTEVLAGGLRPVALGLLGGLALAAVFGQLLAGYLYQVPSHDPLTFGAVGLGVLLVGAAAALGPARRAAGLDPLAAIRAE
jgi:putative ABC transport system permease protein